MLKSILIAMIIVYLAMNTSKVLSFLKGVILKLVSLLFVKVSVSTVSNITGAKTYNLISTELVEKSRIKFLSRSYYTNNNRKVKAGSGFFTCFNEILYFAHVIFEEPMIRVESYGSRPQDIWEAEPEVVKKINLYIPFWKINNMKKVIRKVSELDKNKAVKFTMYNLRNTVSNIKNFRDHDITIYDQKDLDDFEKSVIEKINSPKDVLKRYISLEGKYTINIIEHIAKKNNMNVFIMDEFQSCYISSTEQIMFVEDFLKFNDGKPFILFLSATRNPEDFPYKFVTYRASRHYTHLENDLIQMLLSDIGHVIILDQSGSNGSKGLDVDKYGDGFEKFHEKFLLDAKIHKIGENNAVSK